MKKTVAFTAVAGAALISSAASAVVYTPALDQTFALQPIVFGLSGTSGAVGATQTIDIPANPLPVVGITISFSYSEQGPDSSWASDLGLRISGPGIPGGPKTISGTDGGGGPFGLGTLGIWSFDGAGSTGDGNYSSTFWFKSAPWSKPGGAWTIETAHSWDGGQTYSNVMLTLHKTPAPGALALLGVAGLVGSRRRRA